MIGLIIFAIIFFIIAIFVEFAILDLDSESAVLTNMLIAIVFMLVSFLNALGGEPIEVREKLYDITGLVLQQQQSESFHGAFVLGCGYVGGRNSTSKNYIFFANTENGKILQQTEVNKTYIRETDEESPCAYVIKTGYQRKANWLDRLWGHKKDEMVNSIQGLSNNKYILVVPKGTIQIDYNVEV